MREQVAKTHASSTLALADTFQLPAISYPQILRDALRANVLQVPWPPHRTALTVRRHGWYGEVRLGVLWCSSKETDI